MYEGMSPLNPVCKGGDVLIAVLKSSEPKDEGWGDLFVLQGVGFEILSSLSNTSNR
jgi:hypothetical protein